MRYILTGICENGDIHKKKKEMLEKKKNFKFIFEKWENFKYI